MYRTGDPLRSLYAVRIGSFKTSVLSVDGREQVTGFHIPGEMLGLDAISADQHACNAFALEDSEVCPIPFAQLEKLAQNLPSLQHNLNRLLSREIVRDHSMLMLMGNMNSDERLAAFLLNLSQRFSIRGYSAKDFVLKMRREEIGSYLGLRLETICRGSRTCGTKDWWRSQAETSRSRTWKGSSNWSPDAIALCANPCTSGESSCAPWCYVLTANRCNWKNAPSPHPARTNC